MVCLKTGNKDPSVKTAFVNHITWIGHTTLCFSLRSKDVREGFFWSEVVFFYKNFQFL